MRTIYFDCGMGAAGDMLAASLLELLPDPDAFLKELNQLGIPGVRFAKEACAKCGINGTRLAVTVHGEEEGHSHDHDPASAHSHTHEDMHTHGHPHEEAHVHGHAQESAHTHGGHHAHHHSGLHEIGHIVEALAMPQKVKDDVLAVYGLIAEAESRAHGVPVEQVHFHEVGAMDAVADITAFCLLVDRLAPQRVLASPVHVGSGQVRCAHGILPVPAPATAHLLRGVPTYGGAVKGELCTPTGAALLKHFAAGFGDMPIMTAEAIGYGMGKKDFEAANCVRAFLGETGERPEETVAELCCNLDDMTPEAVGYAMERLLEAGALDVFTAPIGMKKCRPGVLLSVLCREEERERMAALMFRYTTTLGVRERLCRRYTLERATAQVETPFGAVRRKEAFGYGVRRAKDEYEDLARIAREKDTGIGEAADLAKGR
jgi:uncharacterized protein (TIGR00299 family) protein